MVSFSICCNAELIMYDCSFDKFLIVLNPLVLANEYLLIFVRNCMFVCNLGTNLHYKKWLYCTDIILQAQISFSLNPNSFKPTKGRLWKREKRYKQKRRSEILKSSILKVCICKYNLKIAKSKETYSEAC